MILEKFDNDHTNLYNNFYYNYQRECSWAPPPGFPVLESDGVE